MLLAEDLKKAVLQAAIQGKLVEQRTEEGNAEQLYKKIQAKKQELISKGKIKMEKPLPEITEDEIPFDIPDSWKWCRLQEIVMLENGDRSNKYPVEADYVDCGIPFFGAKDMADGVFSFKKIRYITKEKFDELSRGKLRDSDIVCLLRGAVGKTALFKSDNKHTTGFICAQMLIIRNIKLECTPYVSYYLMSPFYRFSINKKITGIAVKQLPAKEIGSLIIPLPPLEEQKRIVDKLDSVLEDIDAYGEAEQELASLQQSFPDEFRKSILQYAMQGKLVEQRLEEGTGEELYQQIQEKKARLIEEGKIKKEKPLADITEDEIPFDIPESWKWARFGEIVDFRMGKTPPRVDAKAWGSDYSWVSISDMISGGRVSKTKEGISEAGFQSFFGGAISPKGTLVMSFKLTIGCVSILDINALHNEAIISIFPIINDEQIMRDYLFKIMPYVSKTGDSKKAIKGNTLNSKSLKNLLVPLPPIEEQRRIVEKLDTLLPIIDDLSETV